MGYYASAVKVDIRHPDNHEVSADSPLVIISDPRAIRSACEELLKISNIHDVATDDPNELAERFDQLCWEAYVDDDERSVRVNMWYDDKIFPTHDAVLGVIARHIDPTLMVRVYMIGEDYDIWIDQLHDGKHDTLAVELVPVTDSHVVVTPV